MYGQAHEKVSQNVINTEKRIIHPCVFHRKSNMSDMFSLPSTRLEKERSKERLGGGCQKRRCSSRDNFVFISSGCSAAFVFVLWLRNNFALVLDDDCFPSAAAPFHACTKVAVGEIRIDSS